MLTAINPNSEFAPTTYSQAIEAKGFERLLFISGQVGITPEGHVAEGIEAQTQTAIANLNAVLKEAGLEGSNIAKMTIFLTDGSLFEPFIAAATPTLPNPPPATTLVIVKGLAMPELLVEVEAIAVG